MEDTTKNTLAMEKTIADALADMNEDDKAAFISTFCCLIAESAKSYSGSIRSLYLIKRAVRMSGSDTEKLTNFVAGQISSIRKKLVVTSINERGC